MRETVDGTAMGVAAGERIDQRMLADILNASGVKVTADEVDAVARALTRINAAATVLLTSLPFDETAERFYRLLENDGAQGAPA